MMNSRVFWFVCFAATAVLALALPAAAGLPQGVAGSFFTDDCGVTRVPEDYATIQAAIDAASDGSVILVGPGTYSESLTIANKRLAVQGQRGWTSVIGQGAPVARVTGAGSRVMLSGLSLEGGTGPDGAGLFVEDAELWLVDSLLDMYEDEETESVVYLDNADAVVAYTHFTNNHCSSVRARGGNLTLFGSLFYTFGGAAIDVAQTASCTLLGNHIEATVGEAMLLSAPGEVMIADNRLLALGGRGIVLTGGSGAVLNNVIGHCLNASLNIRPNGPLRVWNNTIHDGRANAVVVLGGEVSLFNNIIANITGNGLSVTSGSAVTADHNLFWENSAGAYGGEAEAGPHDLSADPLLIDGGMRRKFLAQEAAGQEATSPAVNAGSGAPGDICLPADADLSFCRFLMDDSGVFRGETCLSAYTTRTDLVPDQGAIDLGAHYPLETKRAAAPAPAGAMVELLLNQQEFRPSDLFDLDLRVSSDELMPADYYVLLDVWGDYYFWPGWGHYPQQPYKMCGPVCQTSSRINIISFDWPAGAGEASGIMFWAVLAEPGTYSILGTDVVTWGFTE